MQTRSIKAKKHGRYKVDTRPLCQGMPFVLTDAAHPRMVLKNGSHFLVLDQGASIPACNTLGYGYYRYDTRYLSEWELLLNGVPLSLLSTNVAEGYTATFLHTNVQIEDIPQQSITVRREVVLHDLLWEKIIIENYLNACVECELTIRFQSDFADMFEVRGLNREQRGERMIPVASRDLSALFLAYRGTDNILLESLIEFHGMKPTKIEEGEVTFKIALNGRERQEFEMSLSSAVNGKESAAQTARIGYDKAKALADEEYKSWVSEWSSVYTEHELFNASINRGYRDIFILRQPTPKGYGIAAGVPWYSAVFGRDSAITSWQLLPYSKRLAKETIDVLARYQGTKENPRTEESAGRIMHEIRFGELARNNQIPHTPYYGTVDATQLWLLLLCEYVDWTGDLDYARKLWPRVKSAIDWLNRTADNGYLGYIKTNEDGLENQGWKDSHDSVVYRNGQIAKPPIYLCEAQAYLYAAKKRIADLAEKLKYKSYAARLRDEAAKLKLLFQKDFWMPEDQYLALALDGDRNLVDGLASNPGHCLFTDILDDDKAHIVADRLMTEDFWSGWGIRTLHMNNPAYNPISYHNGSVWPHDNSIIAHGLRRIGRTKDVHQIMHALHVVAEKQTDYRLPELFCGFGDDDTDNPIDYPVSCSPQAWAAGSLFQLLSACLNIKPDAVNNTLRIVEPSLPEWLGKVVLRNVHCGNASVDLAFSSRGNLNTCEILGKTGHLKVIIES